MPNESSGPRWYTVRCLFGSARGEGFSYEERMTLWYTESFDNSSGFSVGSWNTPCTTTNNATTPCNLPGYAVQVRVTYSFPMNIPFWGSKTIPITSVSKMMINE